MTTDSKTIPIPYFGVLNDRFVIVLFLLIYLFLNKEYRIENVICLFYGFFICKYNKFFELEFLSNKYITNIELSDIGKILKLSDYFVSAQNSYMKINNNNSNITLNGAANSGIFDVNDERMGLKAANELENVDFLI